MGSSGSAQKSFRFRLHPGERRIILLVGDLLMAILALFIAIYLWGQKDWLDFSTDLLIDRVPPWFFVLPVIWIILNVEMYDIRRAANRVETIKGISISAGASLVLYMFLFFLSEPNSLPRRGVAFFIAASSLLMLAWRLFYIQVFTAPGFMRRVLIVGAGRAGTTLLQVIRES
jgi:FlaA1/EpsC-like NDP-sugar epimerase